MPPKKSVTKSTVTSTKTPAKTTTASKGKSKPISSTSKKTPATPAKTPVAATEKATATTEKKEEPVAPVVPKTPVVEESIKIKQLADKLSPEKEQGWIKAKKWPCILDPATTAGTYLRYRDTNYIQASMPKDMFEESGERIRKALIGGIRYGKPLVIDMGDTDKFEMVTEQVNKVQAGLMEKILDKRVLEETEYTSLVKPDVDGDEYKPNNFSPERIANFVFILLMSGESRAPPPAVGDKMYYILVE